MNRDIRRIKIFTDELAALWSENFPDWRFGQFCINFFSWLAAEKKDSPDIFFIEEAEMMKYIKEYIQENS